jgi:hypothetical protein
MRLQYPPAMILFKPYHYTFGRLEGLPDGVIPIFPSEIKFNIIIYHTKDRQSGICPQLQPAMPSQIINFRGRQLNV